MPIVTMPDGTDVELPDELDSSLANRLKKLTSSTPASNKSNLQDIMKRGKKSLMEVGAIADTTIRGGVLGLPKYALEAGKALEEYVPESVRKFGNVPGLGTLRDKAIEAMTPLKPSTQAGQVIGNVGASAVGALAGPGNILKNAIIGTSGGMGAETAAATLGDTPVTRIAGGLAGGGVAGLATASRGNTRELANEAIKDLTPQELNDAARVMREAEQSGIPINLSQALDRPSNVDTYVSALAHSPQGTNTSRLLREQPARVQEEARRNINNLPGVASDPYTIANRTQGAATKVLNDLRKQRSQVFQQTLANEKRNAPNQVDDHIVRNAYSSLTNEMKRHRPETSEYRLIGDLRDRLVQSESPPIMNANGQLVPKMVQDPDLLYDTLKDYKGKLGSIQTLATQNLTGNSAKYAKSLAQDTLDRLGDALKPHREADKAYAQFTRDHISPIKKSIIGRLAGRKGEVAEQEAALNPLSTALKKGTTEGSNSQILEMEKNFRNAGRQGDYQNAIKSHLANTIDEAFKSNTNRANPKSAENLSENLGNFRQLSNISRGTKGIQNDDAYASGFRRFMNIVSRAANRPETVTGTGHAEIMKKAAGNIFQRMGQVSIIQPLRQPALAYATLLKNNSLETIDRLLNSPEGISMLVQLGRQPRLNQASQAAIATFLSTNANIQANKGKELKEEKDYGNRIDGTKKVEDFLEN